MFLKKNGTNGTEKIFKDIIEEYFPEIKKILICFLKRYKTINFKVKDCVSTQRKVSYKGRASYYTILTSDART
jgi:hypothetical protein